MRASSTPPPFLTVSLPQLDRGSGQIADQTHRDNGLAAVSTQIGASWNSAGRPTKQTQQPTAAGISKILGRQKLDSSSAAIGKRPRFERVAQPGKKPTPSVKFFNSITEDENNGSILYNGVPVSVEISSRPRTNNPCLSIKGSNVARLVPGIYYNQECKRWQQDVVSEPTNFAVGNEAYLLPVGISAMKTIKESLNDLAALTDPPAASPLHVEAKAGTTSPRISARRAPKKSTSAAVSAMAREGTRRSARIATQVKRWTQPATSYSSISRPAPAATDIGNSPIPPDIDAIIAADLALIRQWIKDEMQAIESAPSDSTVDAPRPNPESIDHTEEGLPEFSFGTPPLSGDVRLSSPSASFQRPDAKQENTDTDSDDIFYEQFLVDGCYEKDDSR